MNWTLVILGVILLIVIYILYKVIKEKGKTVANKIDLTVTNDKLSMSKLETPNSSRYYLMTWIFVEQKVSQNDTMIKIQDSSDSTKVKLSIELDTSSTLKYTISDNNVTQTTTHTIMENFPLQKWVHIIVSVDNEFVDCYVDGKLVRSARVYTPGSGSAPAAIPSIPPDNSVPVLLAPVKFDAYVAKFKRWIYPINPQTAYSEYMKGNGQGWPGMPNFGLDMTVMKDNEIYKEITVF